MFQGFFYYHFLPVQRTPFSHFHKAVLLATDCLSFSSCKNFFKHCRACGLGFPLRFSGWGGAAVFSLTLAGAEWLLSIKFLSCWPAPFLQVWLTDKAFVRVFKHQSPSQVLLSFSPSLEYVKQVEKSESLPPCRSLTLEVPTWYASSLCLSESSYICLLLVSRFLVAVGGRMVFIPFPSPEQCKIKYYCSIYQDEIY